MKGQSGRINAGMLVLLAGGLLLVGLLAYGWQSGHELPVWPALAVVAVNIFAAVKLVMKARKGRGPGAGS